MALDDQVHPGISQGPEGIRLDGYGIGTVLRNPAWASDVSIWRAMVQTSPRSAKAHLSLALVLNGRGGLEDQSRRYRRGSASFRSGVRRTRASQ